MAQYLSTLMMHRFRMEAVEHIISKATQMLQNEPKGQNPAISLTAFQGITKMATNRSDTANEITKKLVTFDRRWRNLMTATQTRVFPRSVESISKERKQPVSTRNEESFSAPFAPPSMVVVFSLIAPERKGPSCISPGLLTVPGSRNQPDKSATTGNMSFHTSNIDLPSNHLHGCSVHF